jgi:hypothetical protein
VRTKKKGKENVILEEQKMKHIIVIKNRKTQETNKQTFEKGHVYVYGYEEKKNTCFFKKKNVHRSHLFLFFLLGMLFFFANTVLQTYMQTKERKHGC